MWTAMIGHNQLGEPVRQEVVEGFSMVVRHFVDAIKHLSELRLVAVEGSPPSARLWAIILRALARPVGSFNLTIYT